MSMLTVGVIPGPKEMPLGRAALSTKRCSKARGADPVPAEPSALAEQARGEGETCTGPRGGAPASASRAAAFTSAVDKALSCC